MAQKRLIDANAFLQHWNKEYRHQYANDMFKIAIANFPTVDAVEVVRCKDCKKWDQETWFCDEHSTFGHHGLEWDMFDPNDFCSYGERRTDG